MRTVDRGKDDNFSDVYTRKNLTYTLITCMD
jgi:hypothetical protein